MRPTARAFFLCALPAMILACCQPAPPPSISPGPTTATPLPRTRQEFAAAFARVHEGMSAAHARAILGPPDDIRTQTDPGGITLTDTREIWRYGSHGHLSFATLGSLSIDVHDHVQYIRATHGAADLAALGEPEVRRLLRLIDAASAPGLTGNQFHPLEAIAAINALQPLGQKTGVALLHEYLDVDFGTGFSTAPGIFAVMRGLFEPPAAGGPLHADYPHVVEGRHLRPPALGSATWWPQDLDAFPLFPLVLVQDVPLVPISGYALAGGPEAAINHLHELDAEAAWRQRPLVPTDDPLSLVAQAPAKMPPAQVKVQLFHLLETVYPDPFTEDSDLSSRDVNRVFAEALPEIAAMHIRWDPARCAYVRGDGTMLAPAPKPPYRRTILDPHIQGISGKAQIVVERRSPHHVRLNLNVTGGGGDTLSVRVATTATPPQILVDDPATATEEQGQVGSQGGSSAGYDVELPAGAAMRIEVTHGHEHFQSLPIEP